jgi:protein-L-isoaspartate(D-aspartate) O-methyltransferase
MLAPTFLRGCSSPSYVSAVSTAMSFDLPRNKMVSEQLVPRDIHDPRVLAAMERVPREAFVPESLQAHAYEDRALPIGFEQTISQPYTVAFMCQEARVRPTDKVLEIGTGSGYGAAVLAELAREVHAIERIGELWETARVVLAAHGYHNVVLHLGDGSLGLPAEGPFDVIVCTAGAERLPTAYQEQLAEGGRLLIPIGPAGHQQMYRFTRKGDEYFGDKLGSFGFVPLIPSAEG